MDNNTMMILIILAVLVIAFFALRGRGRAGEKPAPAEAGSESGPSEACEAAAL